MFSCKNFAIIPTKEILHILTGKVFKDLIEFVIGKSIKIQIL